MSFTDKLMSITDIIFSNFTVTC